jgi:hypothetical protein
LPGFEVEGGKTNFLESWGGKVDFFQRNKKERGGARDEQPEAPKPTLYTEPTTLAHRDLLGL